ncbi:MAG: DUF6508 domain-containing protein [Vicingaceae bacterium]
MNDWKNWTEGREMIAKDDTDYSELDLVTLIKLFTVMVRQDRFSDGFLVDCFERGVVLKVLKAIQTKWKVIYNITEEFLLVILEIGLNEECTDDELKYFFPNPKHLGGQEYFSAYEYAGNTKFPPIVIATIVKGIFLIELKYSIKYDRHGFGSYSPTQRAYFALTRRVDYELATEVKSWCDERWPFDGGFDWYAGIPIDFS